MKNALISFFKGFWIGGTMTVPGVSGGSMAMILNIYDRIIKAIASFRKDIKSNLPFLIQFALGGIIGALLFSKYIIIPLLEAYPLITGYFFLGAVAGGAPIILKTANVKKPEFKAFAFPLLGMIPTLLISIIPNGFFSTASSATFIGCLVQFLSGFFVAIPFVLPGISVSQVLLMMGIYKTLMTAAGNGDFSTLFSFIPLVIGTIIGTLLVAKIMQRAIDNHPQTTYLIIFGFLLGSLPQLIYSSGIPDLKTLPFCALTFVLGFCFIYFLQKLEVKKAKN